MSPLTITGTLTASTTGLTAAIDAASSHAHAASADAASDQVALFGAETQEANRPRMPERAEWPELERLAHEFDVLGFYFSSHPLEGYRHVLGQLGVGEAASVIDPERTVEGRPHRLAGVVVGKQERKTARSRFAFVMLSDLSAQYEVMIFSDLLEHARPLLEIGRALLVVVDARLDNGEVKLTGQQIEPLERRARDVRDVVEIEIESVAALNGVRAMLEGGETGGALVRLILPTAAGTLATIALPDRYLLPYTRMADVEAAAGVVRLGRENVVPLRAAS